MKAVILAGHYDNEATSPCLLKYKNQFLLDYQIEKLIKLKYQVVVVLGDKHADRITRECKNLQLTELAYDDIEDSISFMSNIKAGITGVNNGCFVLPVHVPCPEDEVWNLMRIHLHREGFNTATHTFIPYTINPRSIDSG